MTNKEEWPSYSTCGGWKDHEEHSGNPLQHALEVLCGVKVSGSYHNPIQSEPPGAQSLSGINKGVGG